MSLKTRLILSAAFAALSLPVTALAQDAAPAVPTAMPPSGRVKCIHGALVEK